MNSTITSFHKLPPKGEGQTFRIAGGNPKGLELENDYYVNLVAQGLEKYGWRRVAEGPSDYLVGFAFDMKNGGIHRGYREVWGQTSSGSSTYHSGTISSYSDGYQSANYSGTSHTPATYGVVGVVPTATQMWDRLFLITVKDRKDNTLLQGRVFSTGSVSNLSVVMPKIIASYFEGFPGVSGATVIRSKSL